MIKLKEYGILIKQAVLDAGQCNIFKLSASLSFYTIFSIGPIMFVIIYISNLFFSKQAVEGSIYNQIGGLIGSNAAIQIQELIKNTSLSNNSFVALIGFVLLFITATTVFTEIQNSMNTIWNLKVIISKDWQQTLKNRMISFFIITGLGLLALLVMVVNGFVEGFMVRLQEIYPKTSVQMFYTVNLFFIWIIVLLFFAFTYKVLPDIFIQWKYVFPGAVFAAVLFMIGKFGLTLYINNSNLNNAYSSTGSFVILLLWVYYSASILYFGAVFTKIYALKYGKESIIRKRYAEHFTIVTDSKNDIRRY